jgi:D-threo-aldose 1-dehydrogenase
MIATEGMRNVIDLAQRRRLGRSAVGVSPLGFGGNALSNLYAAVDEAQALDAVRVSYAAGVRYFDTAPLYGHGLGEHRMGQALRGFPRDSYVLSSKVGRLLRPHGRVAPVKLTPRQGGIFVDELPFSVVFDYSAEGVRRSIEDSLQRLGMNRIDVALIHDVDRWTHGPAYEERLAQVIGSALPELQRAKDEGLIGAIGAGVNDVEACLRLADQPAIDCFMLAGRYTLLERTGSDELFARCAERQIAIIAAAPFNSGILATGATPEARYNYLPATPEILERVRRLERLCAKHGVLLPAAALQFPLRHPAVAGLVAGCRSGAEAQASLALLAEPIPADFWLELRTLDAQSPVLETAR